MKYCRSWGERKRLRWPRGEPEHCGMKCAAMAFGAYANAGPLECDYCTRCGNVKTDHWQGPDGSLMCDDQLPDVEPDGRWVATPWGQKWVGTDEEDEEK